MTRPFLLQISGAPRLLADGAERHVPGRRAWALLSCLALDGATTRARLSSMLWARLDESSARRNLRRELARLREAGLGTLVAGDDVLALAEGVACDVADFDAAVSQGDPELALAVWRGPLMEGFELGDAPAFDAWLAQQRDTLARRWRDATNAAAQLRETGGDMRGALELRLGLVTADPLCEPEVVHAMRLHERLGDRKAALALYEQCRDLLSRELGLEPMTETRALAERLRAGERLAPVLPGPARPTWVWLDAPMVGRDDAADRLRTSRAAVLLIEGDAGVGKTRLAQEELRARRTVVLRCSPRGRGGALQPVAEVLADALARLSTAERLGDIPADTRRELARLLPAFDPDAPPDPVRSDAAAQRRFLDALADALDALARADGQSGSWLVDDLHWADEATLALVRHAAHRRARDPARHARVVATARSAELADDGAAQAAVLALEREGLLERLPLAPLVEADTLALVRALAGGESGDGSGGSTLFARRLQRTTAGNPYHLLETLRFLFDAGELQIDAQGGWSTRYDDATADYAELPVPPSVAQAVLERADRLGAATRRVLDAAALAGDGFTLDDVQPATALSEFEALDGLERALQARLLAEAQPGYRFAHELARSAIDARLGPERRRRIHARLAQVQIARCGRADRIALHLEGAGEPRAAVPWRLRAAAEAERVFARHEALAHLEAALADGPAPTDEIEARRRRVTLLRATGGLAAAWAEFDRLQALAEQHGDADARFRVRMMGLVRALDHNAFAEALQSCIALQRERAPSPADELQLLRTGGFAAMHLDRGPLAEDWLARALALAESLGSRERVGIEANLIHVRVSGGALDAAANLTQRALARAGADDSPVEHALLLNAAARVHEAAGERRLALADLDQALALLRTTQSQLFVLMLQMTRARMLIEIGDAGSLADARLALQEADAIVGPSPQPRQHYALRMMQARLAWAEGRVADALADLQAARERLADQPAVTANAVLLLARWRALTGDFDGALALAGQAAAAADPEPPMRAVQALRAWHALAAGDAAGARTDLERALAGPSAMDEFWSQHHELACCVLGAAACALGDLAGARAAVQGVRWSPAMQALAWAVRVAAGASPDDARAWQSTATLPPIERGLLEAALAGRRPLAG